MNPILEHMLIGREMTMQDIRDRVRRKTGADVSPDAVKLALQRPWEDGMVETDEITTHHRSRREKVQTFMRVR